MTRNLQQWINFINCNFNEALRSKFKQKFNRAKKIAAKLDLCHSSCPVITVVGTNGKGSCVSVLKEIYQAAGWRTGTTTSPHLINFNERICFDGEPVDDDVICTAFADIEKACQSTPLNIFQYTTLAALLIFKQKKPDIVILEAGIGGLYDTVDTVDNDMLMITSISLDHCEILGNTREEIARYKVGIARYGKPVVCGDFSSPNVIAEIAQARNCAYFQQNRDFIFRENIDNWDWSCATVKYEKLPKPPVLIQNAATALMGVELFQPHFKVAQSAICSGLSRVNLSARRQVIRSRPIIIYDVAHNADSVSLLMKTIKSLSYKGKCRAIFGALSHKNIGQLLTIMQACVDKWYLTDINHPEAVKSDEIAQLLGDEANKQCFSSPLSAHHTALTDASEKDVIVIFGSFYLVGAILRSQEAVKI